MYVEKGIGPSRRISIGDTPAQDVGHRLRGSPETFEIVDGASPRVCGVRVNISMK